MGGNSIFLQVKRVLCLLVALGLRAYAMETSPLTHRLQAGQTMAAVARMYGVPLADILLLNAGLDPRHLEVGTAVLVPASAPIRPSPDSSLVDLAGAAPETANPPSQSGGEWELVTLADGRRGWAPRLAMLIPAPVPQAPSQVVELALKFVGAPYVWGGMSPNGVDCSGFVQEVFRLSGHSLPRLADEQFQQTTAVDAPQVGDLVFFSTYLPGPSHVGISLGGTDFLHASSSRGVTRASLEDNYFKTRFLGAHRVLTWVPPSAPLP